MLADRRQRHVRHGQAQIRDRDGDQRAGARPALEGAAFSSRSLPGELYGATGEASGIRPSQRREWSSLGGASPSFTRRA